MVWDLIAGAVKGLVSPITQLGSQWMAQKHAKSQAKIAIQNKIATGEIDYNTWAQKAGMASWKDEWLTIWTTGVVTALFFPQTQDYVINGMMCLDQYMPDWFAWCFCGMYVAVFGLKGWKAWKNGG